MVAILKTMMNVIEIITIMKIKTMIVVTVMLIMKWSMPKLLFPFVSFPN